MTSTPKDGQRRLVGKNGLGSKRRLVFIKKDTIVVNLFAGPGAGKSTMAANIFAELKWVGVTVEMALEYAKELVWEERFATLENQIYVFGKQLHRINRLVGKVDVIITDSPLLLSSIYKPDDISQSFDKLVLEEFNKFNNVNYFIERRKPFNQKGRLQTEEQAKEKDKEIKEFLNKHFVFFHTIPGDSDGVNVATLRTLHLLEHLPKGGN